MLTYAQGQTATLVAQFVTSPEGMPVDVPDATVEVFAPDISVALPPTAMINVLTGFYYFYWAIPNSQPVGTYTVRYTGTVLGIPVATTDTINLIEAGSSADTTSDAAAFAIAALEKYLACAQNIPVYHELSRRIGVARTIHQLSWPRWNLGNHIIKMNNHIIDSGYTLNLDTGTITFASPRHNSDVVSASYNFRFFSQADLLRFLNDALSQINLEAPGTAFTLDNVPPSYIGVLMQGAAKNAIKKLLLCLNFQEPATIFGGREGAQQAISNLNSLKENYEKEFTTDKKQIKRARYPSTVGVVQPEYTLPGGRCLDPNTLCTCKIDGKKSQETIQHIFDMFNLGKEISILSMCHDHSIMFAPISTIWNSGHKQVCFLETASGYSIRCSIEHLFWSAGAYKPLMDLRPGDMLMSMRGIDTVASWRMLDETTEMYDLEVPSVKNLFANGILCHNSRWFRYLFSGGAG